jgi:hypothetical protein
MMLNLWGIEIKVLGFEIKDWVLRFEIIDLRSRIMFYWVQIMVN